MEQMDKIEDLVEHAKEYLANRTEQIRLGVIEQSAGVLAGLITRWLLLLIFGVAILLASIATAYETGRRLGSTAAGFLIIAGVYCLFGLIALAAKERLIRVPVMNALIEELLKKNNDDDEV